MNPILDSMIIQNLESIHERMRLSAENAKRDPSEIQLIAVSKTQAIDKIRAMLAAGQRLFGENRVQEASAKWPEIKAQYPDVSLHLIGPLQTNKITQALALFDVIETVDRPKLADMLAKAKAASSHFPECYIQVNIGKEPQKSGIMPDEADQFITYCHHDLNLPITGVMCIPPAHVPSAPYFTQLAALAKRHNICHISMGMSGDFETAIQCGATQIRIGQALFSRKD